MKECFLSKTFRRSDVVSDKSREMMRMFGVSAERLGEESFSAECAVKVRRGDVVYITGASGAGKSVLLRELAGCFESEEKCELDTIELAEDRTVVDCIEGGLLSTLEVLSRAGLTDYLTVLNRPCDLSEGQKWRFRLAVALSRGKGIVVADEFCSNLDRITAAVIAAQVRRYANRRGTTFLLAGCHGDILGDLLPDVIIRKEAQSKAIVSYAEDRRSDA